MEHYTSSRLTFSAIIKFQRVFGLLEVPYFNKQNYNAMIKFVRL